MSVPDMADAPPRPRKKVVNRTVKLYTYQQAVTDSVFDAFEGKGPKDDVRISVCAPTGSGKTVMMLSIIRDMWAKSQEAHKQNARDNEVAEEEEGSDEEVEQIEHEKEQVLILVPSIQIATQMKAEAKRILRKDFKVDCEIELEQGDTRSDGTADLTIATWQGFNRSNTDRITKMDRRKFGLVIVDECHHAASPFFMRVLQYFNECIPLAEGIEPIKDLDHGVRVKMIGFSATPDRTDKYKTTTAFPVRVHTLEAKPLQTLKRLSKLSYKMIDGGLNIDELLKSCNEHEQDMSGWTEDDRENKLYEKCNAAIINEVQTHFGNGRHYTLVFVSRLRQLFSLKLAFEAIKVHVEAVTGSTGKEKRDDVVSRFRDGQFPVLINCGALVEGADMPCIDCVVLARPTKSKILVTQMIGRGMRISRATDKEDCLILDFTVSSKSGLKRFPDLYALVDDLGASKARATKPRAKKYVKPAPKPKKLATPDDAESDDNGLAVDKIAAQDPSKAASERAETPKEACADNGMKARQIDKVRANELFNKLAEATCTTKGLDEAIELGVGEKAVKGKMGVTNGSEDLCKERENLIVDVEATPDSSERQGSSAPGGIAGVKRKWTGTDDDDVLWVSD